MLKKTVCIILSIILLLLTACSGTPEAASVKAEATVTEDTKFGAATVLMSQEELEECGFILGDSVNIEFSNGYKLSGVPYYNGYYVKLGAPVVVAYPGYEYIAITYNNQGLWAQAELSEGDTVMLSLNKRGEYSDIQDSLGQQYSTDRSTYPSDESFCNFRALSGGNMKENVLYRGASPVDNSRGRAALADALIESADIGFIVDLADSAKDIAEYTAASDFASDFASDYALALIDGGAAVLLDMGSAYQSEGYQQSVAEGLRAMLGGEMPAYIHCLEGKDRTGFVCALIEALCGASYDEMLADYMTTYENYYGVTADKTPGKYQAIAELYFDAFVAYLHSTEDVDTLRTADFAPDAAAYLRAGGMTDAEIETLTALLTK